MREQVITWLKNNVSPHRLQHILAVEDYAAQLARYHGVDPQKAAQAGLMHDLAKFFAPQRLLAMASKEGLLLDEILAHHPHLIHAEVSAIVARDRFGVSDVEILDAIRNHTLGCPDMSELSSVVFIADTIEPNRGKTPELEYIRQIGQSNLYQALLLTCDYSFAHLLHKQRVIHPQTLLTRNWALQQFHAQLHAQRSPTKIPAKSII
jgi:predicted HD superfamily hydrolase involved in NAD metabolism